MPPLLLGFIILAGGIWLLRSWGRLKPEAISAFNQKLVGYSLLALAALLAIRGYFNLVPFLLVFALGLIGKAQLLPDGFSKMFSWGKTAQHRQSKPQSSTDLRRDEAYSVLGLNAGATADDIKAAHKRLIKQVHPDAGGSEYLAARINAAKDALLS